MQDTIDIKNRVMSEDENKTLLEKCPVCRLATIDKEGIPYITPVNYAYEHAANLIYIHHASKGGQLLDNLQKSNHVCFEIDEPGEIVNIRPGVHICNGDQIYRSVICRGRMTIAGKEEKLRGLRLLGSKYFSGLSGVQMEEFDPARLDRLAVLVIEIETMSGKCREPRG
jgi:uncharacterized protein